MISREGAVAVPWPAVSAARSRRLIYSRNDQGGTLLPRLMTARYRGPWSAEYRFLAAQSEKTSGWRALSDSHRGRLHRH